MEEAPSELIAVEEEVKNQRHMQKDALASVESHQTLLDGLLEKQAADAERVQELDSQLAELQRKREVAAAAASTHEGPVAAAMHAREIASSCSAALATRLEVASKDVAAHAARISAVARGHAIIVEGHRALKHAESVAAAERERTRIEAAAATASARAELEAEELEARSALAREQAALLAEVDAEKAAALASIEAERAVIESARGALAREKRLVARVERAQREATADYVERARPTSPSNAPRDSSEAMLHSASPTDCPTRPPAALVDAPPSKKSAPVASAGRKVVPLS